MRIINECQRVRSKITFFTQLNNNLYAYSTQHHGAKIIQGQDCTQLLSYKNEHLNFDTTASCFSPDAKLIAFATSTHLHIADLKSTKILKSIYTDHEHLSIISFDPSSQYIVAGNRYGRVLLYRYNSNSQLSRLCSFPYQRVDTKIKKNFVSSITFYKNLLAVSGYGGAIFILDISSRSNKTVLLHSTSPKKALYFIDENNIISGDNKGKLQLISITQNSVISDISLPFTKTAQILPIPNSKYLMVHANTDTLAIIDSKEFKILHSNYLKFDDTIENIAIMENSTLIVSLANKKIVRVDIPNRNTLNSLILHNSIDEAYALVAEEPMLMDTLEYKSLEKIYNKTYKDAALALVNQNIALANQLMEMYKNVSLKKESVALLYRSFEHYNRFKTLYLEKKYALSYAMSEKYPALKLTKQYEGMEERWKEAFTNAQRHIILKKPDFAKALFSDWMTVSSKRPIINLILKHNSLFIDFLKAIEAQDFKRVNEIALENSLFTQMPIYDTLNSDISRSVNRIQTNIKINRIDLAKKSLQKIKGTVGFSQKVEELYSMCDDMTELQALYQKNNFYACYELLDAHTHLYYSELGELLQKHWSKLIDDCEGYASKGNIQGVKATLGELITLNSRKDRIGDLLRVSFQVQTKYFLSKKRFRSAQSVIYAYIDIFSKDSEISSLMKKYEALSKKKLAITQGEDRSRDSWLYSSIITD
ncbi:MAG: WD40 repeat domain-containing protein [Campylobacterota bacterium]|nr:WD40 repeat domain-containing protein [Campylobacterota bacterium]